jgi:lipopolysaccharide/colanic/teichoic acid biosynthesis glycosyltransferase
MDGVAATQGTLVTGAALRTAIVRAAKRSFDVVAAGILLLLILPVLALLAVLVRIDSPGPSFHRCERVGFRGARLRMLKFRKMHAGAAGAPLTKAGDARLTRLGRWLAISKLDELPQLWHVLTGAMSFVGPRPESAGFVDRHGEAYRARILTVRPGVFGLSQLAFASESRVLDPEDPVSHYVERLLPQKVALDVLYAERPSLRFDAQILFWSFVAVVLRRPVAVNRRSGAMRLRRR